MPLSSVYFINRGIVQYSRNEVVEGVISNNENFGLEDYDSAQVKANLLSRTPEEPPTCRCLWRQLRSASHH